MFTHGRAASFPTRFADPQRGTAGEQSTEKLHCTSLSLVRSYEACKITCNSRVSRLFSYSNNPLMSLHDESLFLLDGGAGMDLKRRIPDYGYRCQS
jgi:hypothetical protein